MILWLASYPRSGNSLVTNLLRRHFGIPAYSIYQEADYLAPIYGYLDQGDLHAASQSPQAFFVKTHEMPTDDSPAIYIVRDGRDALMSYAHYIIEHEINLPTPVPENPLLWALEALIESPDQFGGWGNHVFAWTGRKGKTAIVRYEDLLQTERQVEILNSALDEVGMKNAKLVTRAPISDFKEFHKETPRFYRKGQSGTWGMELPSKFHLRFWEQYGDAMQALGYEKDADLLRLEYVMTEAQREMGDISRLTADLNASMATNQNLTHELFASRADVERIRSEKDILEADLRRQMDAAIEYARLQQLEAERMASQAITEKEQIIAGQFQELVAKENVIQNFRNSMDFAIQNGPFRSMPLVGKIHRAWTRLTKRLRGAGKIHPQVDDSPAKRLNVEIIPLGVNCDVAHYLRENSLRQAAYPFDWNVTPIQSAITLIANDFQDFLSEENLAFLPPVRRLLFKEEEIDLEVNADIVTPVLCKKYNMLFPHDFSVNAKADLESARGKYAKRIQRLREVLQSDREVWFVRQDAPLNEWQNAQYQSAVGSGFENPSENWKSLLDKVLRKKYPSLKYRLLEFDEFKDFGSANHLWNSPK